MQGKTVLWGLGNELLGDDAAGIIAARRISDTAPKGWTISECGTVPENFLRDLAKDEVQRLIVVDAADMGLEPGEIRLLTLDDAKDFSFSTHGLALSLLLEPYANFLEIVIIAIQPLTIAPGNGLSEAVKKAVDSIISAVPNGSWKNYPRLHQEKRSPR
ncbi:MAG TPA: hydrogenase 3 maturation endopeptidase HyCI [Synergistaceae bacterium]|jgi:hydrogenase 3 maturation protease|nr:MAG: Hydrogenase maturation protease [Synergistales bacterium 53_16]KUL02870.1 MAG: Hydrogenase maturation protease [Synergistales bacterium 54_9]MDK2845880.1 hydrogenase 3 maturation protease [Synergistales bacterium]HAA47164.1 hydrogenase 3 maturation endopeptidase HyCI [Synergistaceae bacterium]MDN5336209.1 hydrogenase 3 maturation protease [Synergistales bacterium]